MKYKILEKKEVIFMSQQQAEEIDPSCLLGKKIIISITDPGEFANLQDGWDDVLRLQFNDIDFQILDYTLFSDKQAEYIKNFLYNNSDFDLCVVHCYAGISRSAAVAKYISERFNLYYPKNYALYNKFVYAKLNGFSKNDLIGEEDA